MSRVKRLSTSADGQHLDINGTRIEAAMMLEQPRKRPRPGAVPKDTLSLPYLLQATTVALEALSLVFAITLLSSLDQAPCKPAPLPWRPIKFAFRKQPRFNLSTDRMLIRFCFCWAPPFP